VLIILPTVGRRMFAIAVVLAVAAAPTGRSARVGVAFLLAVALGAQNTSVRRLSVPDLICRPRFR